MGAPAQINYCLIDQAKPIHFGCENDDYCKHMSPIGRNISPSIAACNLHVNCLSGWLYMKTRPVLVTFQSQNCTKCSREGCRKFPLVLKCAQHTIFSTQYQYLPYLKFSRVVSGSNWVSWVSLSSLNMALVKSLHAPVSSNYLTWEGCQQNSKLLLRHKEQ